MIEPLRYRSLGLQLDFDELNGPALCWQCMQQHRLSTPAFCFCHECGKRNGARPFCMPCFLDYHKRKMGRESHKPHPIVRGDPVIVQTLLEGDGVTFPKMHEWVTLDYTLSIGGSDTIIENSYTTKSPLIFQSGCSGSCIHLQLLGCTRIAAADILGSSDPYCAVYWHDRLVGVTTTKHMTLDPEWANQTFVLPLTEDFITALGDTNPSNFFNVDAALPPLRIDVFDWDRLSKNDFLGQARISDAELLSVLREQKCGDRDEDVVLSLSLMPKLSRGKLAVRLALRGHDLYVHIVRGKDLPRADPFSLSDPYCMVYWNDVNVGRTLHVSNTLDPVWDREIFHIKVDSEGPNSVIRSTLQVVCLDWDKCGSDDVLGHVELKGSHILDISNGAYHPGEGEDTTSTRHLGGYGYMDDHHLGDFIQAFRRHEREHTDPMVVDVPRGVFGQYRMHGLGGGGAPRPHEMDSRRPSHVGCVRGSYQDGNQGCLEKEGIKPQGTHMERHADKQRGGPDSHMATSITHGEGFEGHHRLGRASDGCRVTGGSASEERRHKQFEGQVEVPSGEVTGDAGLRDAHRVPSLGHGSSPGIVHEKGPEWTSLAGRTSDIGPARAQDIHTWGQKGTATAIGVLRAAYVQRFEEDRGALVQFLDDESVSWIAPDKLPLLEIRESTTLDGDVKTRTRAKAKTKMKTNMPVKTICRSLFEHGQMILGFSKGNRSKMNEELKASLDLAVNGARMQWFQLELSGEHSGANFVRGTVNVRFLRHTRGSVLRGLDIGVSRMSLGETARVEVRSDYGFGEVFAARRVPPYATLVFTVRISAIGGRSAELFLFRRAAKETLDIWLSRLRLALARVSSSFLALQELIREAASTPNRRRRQGVATSTPASSQAPQRPHPDRTETAQVAMLYP